MAYSLNELNNGLPKLIVIMKKEEIYVSVESKEQAEMFRKVLEAMGEVFDNSLHYYNHSTSLSFDLPDKDWFYSSIKSIEREKAKITFGELIDLLQRKPLLISEDGVPLYEGDEYHEALLDDGILRYCKGSNHFLSINARVITIPNESKAFSTKQAALEWIEAQKPKEIKVKLNNTYAIVHKRGIVTFESNVARLSFNHVKDIIKAMEELQNA